MNGEMDERPVRDPCTSSWSILNGPNLYRLYHDLLQFDTSVIGSKRSDLLVHCNAQYLEFLTPCVNPLPTSVRGFRLGWGLGSSTPLFLARLEELHLVFLPRSLWLESERFLGEILAPNFKHLKHSPFFHHQPLAADDMSLSRSFPNLETIGVHASPGRDYALYTPQSYRAHCKILWNLVENFPTITTLYLSDVLHLEEFLKRATNALPRMQKLHLIGCVDVTGAELVQMLEARTRGPSSVGTSSVGAALPIHSLELKHCTSVSRQMYEPALQRLVSNLTWTEL